MPTKQVKFKTPTHASMNYSVRATGVELEVIGHPRQLVKLRVINSRNTLAQGYIYLPLDQITDVIDALMELRAENAIK